MISIENIKVFNFEGALRGMRNPFDSWSKSDSEEEDGDYLLGEADKKLCLKLVKAGSEHRKFLRQIFVSMDITAPLYWWKEFDTYKVGTVANSCSTMHMLHKRDVKLNDFSNEHLLPEGIKALEALIEVINMYRVMYKEEGNKDYWYNMIQLLPSSYNQKRTVTLNYENCLSIANQRLQHRLDEWRIFCDTIFDNLPYFGIFWNEQRL